MKPSNKFLIIYLTIILVLLFGSPFFIYAQTPTPMPGLKGPPAVTPPGFPPVGMLAQHMHSTMSDFVQVDRVYDGNGDMTVYYFNQRHVKKADDPTGFYIDVWVLEEYTPRGRDNFIRALNASGQKADHLKDLKYIYYKVSFAYTDGFFKPYETYYDFQFHIQAGGEVCDSNKKILAFYAPTKDYKKVFDSISTNHHHIVEVAKRLNDRYNLTKQF